MNRALRLSAIGLPSLALFALGVRSFAQEGAGSGLSVCRHQGGDGGTSRKADLEAPARAFAKARLALRNSVSAISGKATMLKDPGYDAGLPGCVRGGEVEKVLDNALPTVFRGRTLHFVSLGKPGKPKVGVPARLEKDDLFFALSYSSLKDVSALARTTGARVSIGTAELANKFGVRCAESQVVVSADGRTLSIKEIAP